MLRTIQMTSDHPLGGIALRLLPMARRQAGFWWFRPGGSARKTLLWRTVSGGPLGQAEAVETAAEF